jgi:hypothetical protein
MTRLAMFDGLLAGVIHWTCAQCGDAMVALFGTPPRNGLCQACHDGYIRGPELVDLLRQAGVPSRFRRVATRESWQTHFRRAWPEELAAAGLPAVVYCWGDTGTGKSSAGAALLAESLSARRIGLWADGLEVRAVLLREFRESIEASEIRRLCGTPFLVFDEPLAGVPTAKGLEQIYQIVRWREAQELPTVITSQIDPADLLEVAGAACASRMLSGLRVFFPGQDVRLRGDT